MKINNAKYYLPALAWALAITIVSAIPHLSAPPVGLTFSDKLAHFTEYFVLGALVTFGSWRSGSRLLNLPVAILLCAAFGAIDELHQSFVPGRSMDIYDVIADTIGASSGTSAMSIYYRKMQKRSLRQSLPRSVK